MSEEKLLGELRDAVRELSKRLGAVRTKPQLYRQEEAARELSISPTKLRRLILSGDVRTTRLGGSGHPMISDEEIRRVIQEGTLAPQTPPPRPSPAPLSVDQEVARAKALRKRR